MSQEHIHQSLRLVSVDGIKPAGAEWYQCKCGMKLLVNVIASVPQDPDIAEAKKRSIPMKKLFYAADQSSWSEVKEALARNNLILELKDIEDHLVPRTQELENGDGYIQQELGQVEQVRALLYRLVPAGAVSHSTTAGPRFRFEEPFYPLFDRLSCIDEKGREWQTRDLAEHDDLGKQVCLNPPVARHKDEEKAYERSTEEPHWRR